MASILNHILSVSNSNDIEKIKDVPPYNPSRVIQLRHGSIQVLYVPLRRGAGGVIYSVKVPDKVTFRKGPIYTWICKNEK